MKKNKKQKKMEKPQEEEQIVEQDQPTVDEKPQEGTPEEQEEVTPQSTIEKLQDELAHEKKEYLFLMAEFDNYRKRTLQEKADLIKSAARRALLDLLPVVDDFERAVDSMEHSDDVQAMKEGIQLIYNKFTINKLVAIRCKASIPSAFTGFLHTSFHGLHSDIFTFDLSNS